MVEIKSMHCDLETFSSVNLIKSGIYKYVESEDFEILLFGYSINDEDVKVIDLASGEKIPDAIIAAIKDNSVIKYAHNSSFERICLSRFIGLSVGEYLNPISWRCTMTWAAYLGLPLSLDNIGKIINIKKKKLEEGKDLIRYFCMPCKPTKVNNGRERNLPEHDPEKWKSFKQYNVRDVEAEIQIAEKLSKFPVPEVIWDEYHLSEIINDRGICIDDAFVNNAIQLNEISRNFLLMKMQNLTGLDNPNSVVQMKGWLLYKGTQMDSLGKKEVAEKMKDASEDLKEVLMLRQKLSKSSIKKYVAMENAVSSGNRIRGMFVFMGANRTGRFSSKIVQLQNLPQNHMPDLAEARGLVRSGNYDALELLYDSIPDTLSELIRTAFVPQNNKKFIVADFSAIEARIIAWLAREKWRIKVFEDGGDIYCASASQMFKVNVVKNGENGHLRQKGKISELALGYGGSVGALKAMGALDMGLNEEELQPLVTAWRNSNPNIVNLWWQVDSAVKECIKNRISTETHGIKFTYKSGFLFITLPSGRKLAYVKPRMGVNVFGGESVTYEGVGSTKKWERLESYGPKFVENIVQGIARDVLCYAMKTLHEYKIVAHVHDEFIIEADRDMQLKNVCELMGKTPPWAEGLLLRADGYECEFYKKD